VVFRKNKFSMQDFLNSSDIDVLIDRFQRQNSYENLNIISERKSSTQFGEAVMFLQKFILDDEDWKSFTEILFEKMNQINRIFYINATKNI
jgi:hypothetical protein